MTKTLTKTTLAILALGMAVPAMAQDSGTFDVSLNVIDPAIPTLTVTGLDDVILGSIAAPALGVGGANSISGVVNDFCVTNSANTAGSESPNVRISVTDATPVSSGGASQYMGFAQYTTRLDIAIWRSGEATDTLADLSPPAQTFDVSAATDCSSRSFKMQVGAYVMSNAPAGNLTETLTVTLTPL